MKCYHLRVLDLKYLKELPSSIGQLKHLSHLQRLPNQFNYLKSLRHLHLEDCTSLSIMAPGIGQLACLKSLTQYVVGSHKGFLLSELKNLKLEGTLHIKHLERVTSVMDAKEANLAEKRLNELELSWERNEESQSEGNEEQILEVLQPHPQLNLLRIKGYFGTQLPHWMRIPALKDLTSLLLEDCKNVFCISSLKNLPSLSWLILKNMEHLRYVDDGSCVEGAARAFNLEILWLKKLPSLKKLSREDGDNMFPCLRSLDINWCPKLILPCLPSVTTLKMFKECDRALLLSIQNLHNLEQLWFFEDKEVTSFPDGMLQCFTCLKELHIYRLEKLEVLPTELRSLKALQVLRIEECNNLQTLTEEALQGLCSLKELAILEYAKFKLSAGFQNLVDLKDLTIAGCPELEDLHECLQHVKGLQSLTLDDLPNLASLPDWFGNLRSLKSLTISRCPKLMSLPTDIQLLNNLKDLNIYACPELVRRCLEQTGDDWHKIAHVPRTYLNKDPIFNAKHGFSAYKRETEREYTVAWGYLRGGRWQVPIRDLKHGN
ncbi:hypothetical protein K1719_017305 [Acacia pycnantha]|nr:hypothetical protein K1719_017305 [Acacia pycnantha]